MTRAPYFWNERDGEQISSHIKTIGYNSRQDALAVCSAMNSSLFYWWYILFSNCRDLTTREIDRFPFDPNGLSVKQKQRLTELCASLMNDYERHKTRKHCEYKATGKVVYDEYSPGHSKDILDEIDEVLAEYYNLTAEEIDYIFNYDLKFRLGADAKDAHRTAQTEAA
jgi:hypothetical protein